MSNETEKSSVGIDTNDVSKRPDLMQFDQENSRTSTKEWAMVLTAIFFELFTLVFFIYLIVWSFGSNGFVLFSWHPALMSFGYVALMTEAILVYSDSSVISRSVRSYSKRVMFHWILQTIAVMCISMGMLAIIVNKFNNNKHHFKSTHSIVGLTAYIFCLLSVIGGVFARFSFKLRQYIRPVLLKVLHSSLSLISYGLGAATLILGLSTKWFINVHTTGERIFGIIAILLIALYTCAKPLSLIYRRINQMSTSI